VTRAEWRVLAALVEDGARTPSALAERAFMQRPVVSRLVGKLVQKGLARHRSPRDTHSRVEVEASAEGRRLYADLFPHLVRINRRLMAALDADEAAQLEGLLAKLWERAKAIYDEGGGVDVRADRRRGGSRRRWESEADLSP
jgi:DNA-binding MarR family transcriptional regulator